MEATGLLLIALTPYPVAKEDGFVVFNWVYRGSALEMLDPFGTPLTKRVVMLQGGVITPTYGMPEWGSTLPMAVGRIVD